MSVVYVVLGIIVAVLLAAVFPWALLRKLDRENKGRKGDSEGP